jgi:hypothetical protein
MCKDYEQRVGAEVIRAMRLIPLAPRPFFSVSEPRERVTAAGLQTTPVFEPRANLSATRPVRWTS